MIPVRPPPRTRQRPNSGGALSALIEDVADGFYEVDLRGDFKFFNDALCRIFGYPRHAIQDRNFRDFLDKENARVAFEAFNQVFREGGSVADITWEVIRPNSERRFLEISAKLIVDGDGRKTGFRGIARDITDKHLAQQALKESQTCAVELSETSRRAEQRYRAFLNFLPEPVFVFNLDHTVSYLNPAFEKVFGWTLEELQGKIIPFVPEECKPQTREGLGRLYREKIIHNFETKRLTKDGRLLDIIIDGAIFYDENNRPAGQVITLRDVTQAKRTARINQALFRISQALYQFRTLDTRLEFITREVRQLLEVEGASVILLDDAKKEFFFRESVFDDMDTGQRMKEVRFPIDKGVAGEVYRTGQPLIVNDTSQSPFFNARVDEEAGYRTRSMLDVPLATPQRMIGVLCAVNKKDGPFTESDLALLSTMANLVALPIENASINEALERSLQEVQSLNRAKDRVIHHLSHELKTPLSVLSASLNLLAKQLHGSTDHRRWEKALERAQRNLLRLLDMQYKIEDLLQEKEVATHRMLSVLLDQCADELEALAANEFGEETAYGEAAAQDRLALRTAGRPARGNQPGTVYGPVCQDAAPQIRPPPACPGGPFGGYCPHLCSRRCAGQGDRGVDPQRRGKHPGRRRSPGGRACREDGAGARNPGQRHRHHRGESEAYFRELLHGFRSAAVFHPQPL